jgi:tetratricopeptide (TPR) repeat protein
MKAVKQDELKKVYEKHIAITSIDDKTPEEALQICGELIDVSFYLKKEDGIRKAIEFLEKLEKKSLSDEQKGTLYYYLGNAHADIGSIKPSQPSWDNENKEKAIYYYRRSLGTKVDKNTKSQILVNLANLYDSLGRFVKSIELYQKAIEGKSDKYPTYMATGNKGISLFHYANIIYDKGHKMYFAYFANNCLNEAIQDSPNNTQEKKAFEEYLRNLNSKELEKIKIEDLKLNDFSLGDSKEEEQYRQWCLKNRLFLNPINDLGEYNISAHDVLHLPNMILDIKQNHVEFPSFFNQLKQEYVSARYLIYEGITNIGKKHFSDREVLLINPLDYPRYSLNVEKIKMSFKAIYSIFDKNSLFMKKYLGLEYKNTKGQDINNINFRKIWYDKGDVKNKTIHPKLSSLDNRAFRGLFLLSKEILFYHPDKTTENNIIQDLTLSLDPSAKEINLLRNYLEHDYVKVHEDFFNLDNEDMFKDKISYSIKEEKLIDYSLRLLKLCREALIYLSLGVHIEEIKKEAKSKGKMIPSIKSDIYEDDWKR